jgi:hypothetical protein
MHIPYNFGHTVEQVAFFPDFVGATEGVVVIQALLGGIGGDAPMSDPATIRAAMNTMKRPDGSVWGHLNPDLHQISNVTGCPLYYTPQKYWPQEIAQNYFNNGTVFGLLRNPAERLVAQFRGALEVMAVGGDYGSDWSLEYLEACDVNSAIKTLMRSLLTEGNRYRSDCAYLPQSEYFEGPYGITLPVNNEAFPSSMNQVFMDHGYSDSLISPDDIIHVSGCPQVWSADLDSETKSLIQQVYQADYDLICQHFGDCDPSADFCIHGVYMMCPDVACTDEQPCATADTS